MSSGIYKIEGPNGRVYIGSAVHIGQRWVKHRSDLSRQKHHCLPLQRAFNKYGAHAFRFTVLERTTVDSLLVREQQALDEVPKCRRYNTCPVAGSRRGDRATSEALANMRRAKAHTSAETRAKIAASHKAAGIRPSREACMRGVATRLARGVSDETRKKLSAAGKGRVHTPEERLKRRLSKTHAMTKANTSGVVGVSRHETGKWMARYNFNGSRQYLGLFGTIAEAAEAIRKFTGDPR